MYMYMYVALTFAGIRFAWAGSGVVAPLGLGYM